MPPIFPLAPCCRSFAWRLTLGWLALALGCCTGCATGRTQLDQQLLARPRLTAEPESKYTVACPDLLEVTTTARPELTGAVAVEADGRISLPHLGRLRVEGLKTAGIADAIADRAGVPAAAVTVRVAEYKSRQIYLAGKGIGFQRPVPYQGPETVLDLLKRSGGITPGAADDVYVVRSRLADGGPPEVFRVDLRAAVCRADEQTNIRLEPYDQVYVGETRRSALEKCVPPCLKPIYESLCGLRRSGSRPVGGAADAGAAVARADHPLKPLGDAPPGYGPVASSARFRPATLAGVGELVAPGESTALAREPDGQYSTTP